MAGIEDLLAPNKYLPPIQVQVSTQVPSDPGTLNLTPDAISQAYSSANMDRNSVLRGNAAARNTNVTDAREGQLVLKKSGDVAALAEAIEKGQAAAANSINSFKAKRSAPELGYVTAAQAKLYIGGILLDECYDVQYQYKEFKEPVYGYLSKTFDAVLKGNIIISGTFTINYKHDAYLIKLLERIQADKTTPGESVKKAYARKQRLEDDMKAYVTMLGDYKSKFDSVTADADAIKAADIRLAELRQQLAVAAKYPTIVKQDYALKTANADKAKIDFMASLTPEDKDKVLSDETKFVDANTSYQEGVGKNNAELQAIQVKIDDTEDRLAEEREKLSAVEAKLGVSFVTASYKQEREAELLVILKTISDLNAAQTTNRDAFNTAQKNSVTYSTEQTEKVQDTLDDNSKAYIALKLQAEKLKDEEKVAAQDVESQNKTIEESIATVESLKKRLLDSISQNRVALEESQKKLASRKDDINSLNKAVMEAATKANESNAFNNKNRAEDFGSWTPGTFSMFIEYNGVIHKILEDCTLTGHGHVVAQGGEVIKEYYTFISKDIR